MSECANIPELPSAKGVTQVLTGQKLTTDDISDVEAIDFSQKQVAQDTLNQLKASINALPAFAPIYAIFPVLNEIVAVLDGFAQEVGAFGVNGSPGSPPVPALGLMAGTVAAIPALQSTVDAYEADHKADAILPAQIKDYLAGLADVLKGSKKTLAGLAGVIAEIQAGIDALTEADPPELKIEKECAKTQAEAAAAGTIKGIKNLDSMFAAASYYSGLAGGGNVGGTGGLPDNIDAAQSFLDGIISELEGAL